MPHSTDTTSTFTPGTRWNPRTVTPEEVAAENARQAEWQRRRDEERAAQPDNREAELDTILDGIRRGGRMRPYDLERDVPALWRAVNHLAEAVQRLRNQKENS